MKIGDLVYSRYPRIHGNDHGIIVRCHKSKVISGRFFPSKVEVFWVVSLQREWIRVDKLYKEEV
tara:strand:+ start:204 stop:395 length:192 start_codon:yes stop_codon:yes gene_type:complete